MRPRLWHLQRWNDAPSRLDRVAGPGRRAPWRVRHGQHGRAEPVTRSGGVRTKVTRFVTQSTSRKKRDLRRVQTGLQQTTVQPSEDGLLPIGIARGNKRTQMLCLRVPGHFVLVVGTDAMLLVDVIGFENGGITLDRPVIHQMVDAATTAEHAPHTQHRQAPCAQDRHAGNVRNLAKGLPRSAQEESGQIGRLVFAADREGGQSTRPRPQHHQETHEILK